MRLLNINGKLTNKNVTRFLIEWDKKSRSIAQADVKKFLYPYWKNNIVYEEFPVYGSLLKVDILNATRKIAIEVHGPQHEDFHYFHNNSRASFLKGIKNDEIKSQWLLKNNFTQVIIYTKEISQLSKEFFEEKFNITL
jgi:hypothetical protein